MYEHRSQPLLPRRHYYRRLVGHAALAVLIIGCSLSIGVIGYHLTEKLSWLDALLNASMILGGMGPVDMIRTASGKFLRPFTHCFPEWCFW